MAERARVDVPARRPPARPEPSASPSAVSETRSASESPSLIAGLVTAIQPADKAEGLDGRDKPGHEGEIGRHAVAPIPHETLLPLFAWLSPGFPVGAYAYSHGLEWAAGAGDLSTEAAVAAWIADVLRHGAGRNDAILLAAAFRAAAADDAAALADANEVALALAPSAELLLETSQQGRSFLDAVLAAWPAESLTRLAAPLDGPVAYPVALGVAAAAHGMPLVQTLGAFLLAFAQNLVSAAIRLAPIGQTAGTRIVAALGPLAEQLARDCAASGLDDVGGCTFRADLGSFRHETQYTRLFRS
jgi:urease accessory protein